MARGIIIFGSSGSGKTTLGKLVAEKLKFPYFDIDDYIYAQWANTLPCKVRLLNGDEDLNKNVQIIVHEYLKQNSQG